MKGLTPWARQRMSDGEIAAIMALAPGGADVSLGYSRGWTCRLRVNGRVVGEAYKAPTPMAAFRAALANMGGTDA